MSQKRDLLSDIVSQKRDLLSDCHWGGRTYRVTMRGEGLSCYVQLKTNMTPKRQNFQVCVYRTVEGLTCHLPFVYKNKTYDECTREDSDSLWCHTGARDQDNQLVRGDCQPGCASKWKIF